MHPNNSNSQNRPRYPPHPPYPTNQHPPYPTNQHPPLPVHPNNPNPQTGPWYQQLPMHQQPPVHQPPFVNPNPYVVQQQFLGSQVHNPPWGEGNPPMQHYHGAPYGAGPSPVFQGGAQQYQHQYQPPSSDPSRNQHSKGYQETEAQYNNHIAHVSSGTISRDHSSGTHPVHAGMGVFNNTGAGGAWKPPSENPSMANYDSTQQVRTKPYKKDRAARSWNRKERTDKVDPSMYEIPIAEARRDATTGGSNIPASKSAHGWDTTNTYRQEQRMEEDDVDTVSLGSGSDDQH